MLFIDLSIVLTLEMFIRIPRQNAASSLTTSVRIRLFKLGVRGFAMAAIKKPEVLFILGGPGAGKGTLCASIVKEFGYVHLSAGELLREEQARPGSEHGELIINHMRNGTIVPVAITCSLLEQAMQNSTSPQNIFLIDGFPRNQDNLDGWNEAMTGKVIEKGVLFLDCSEELCMERCLGRGARGSERSDDNEETLKKRYRNYIDHTLPIIEYYDKKGLVYKINASQKPQKVFDCVEKILKNFE